MMLGQACAASCVRWKPDTPARLRVIPRPGSAAEAAGEQLRVYDAPPAFVFQ